MLSRRCHEGVILCQKDVRWCSEGARKVSDGVRLCQESVGFWRPVILVDRYGADI